MNTAFKALGICMFLFLVSSIWSFAEDEKITMTTFYPSPYGVYKELATDGLKIGATYAGVGNTPPTNGLVVEGNVGIGTQNPEAKLIVSGGEIASNVKVGIGTESPEAILDVKSTTSAFLPPRMTEEKRTAISPKVKGMVVYNTDSDKLEVWNGSNWITTSGGAVARFSLGSSSCGGSYCAGTYLYPRGYLQEWKYGAILSQIVPDFDKTYFDKICEENGYTYFIDGQDSTLGEGVTGSCKYWNGGSWVSPPSGCYLTLGDEASAIDYFAYLSSITCGK